MAGGNNELSSRTIPEDQNEEESDDYQLMFKHFKENKVEIASAITKPFPFLMSLRDRDFISEQKFQEYQETCKNLVPVERVVYDVLSNVQKNFSRNLLKVIFSKTHLKAYPDLKETLKHFFLNVSDSHRTHQRINGRNVEERPRLPSVVREASKTNDEQAEEMLSLPQCNGGEGSSSCEQTRDEQEPQDDLPSSLRQEAARRKKRPNWSNSKRRLQKKKPRQDEMMVVSAGVASPGHGVQEKLKAVSRRTLWKDDSSTNVKEVTKTQRTRMRRAQTSNSQEISKEASKTSGRKRPSTARRTTQVPEKTKNDAVDFSPTLPVTCGKAKGTLFQEKLKQGASKKCIQNEAGDWLTVKEFLNEGRRATSKAWKGVICCNGATLRHLEQKGLLFCTSKSKPQKKGA